MNTDHTSGSSAESAVESTDPSTFTAPVFSNPPQPAGGPPPSEETARVDQAANLSQPAGTEPSPEAGSNEGQLADAMTGERRHGERRAGSEQVQEQDSSHAGNQVVEGVTSIERLVESLQGKSHGFIDETVGRSPSDTEALEFRVIRPGAPVRRLRLTGNRYTFGSAEGCSIRLNDPALRPMHAVLLRDSSRILVRAYSVPVQVNETRMTEATLEVGDVLRLGAYQFELLTISKPSTGSVLESGASESPAILNTERLGDTQGLTPRASIQSLSAEVGGSEDVVWRERLRREIDQWRERQVECDRREGRIDDREAELRNRETELWSRAENLYRRESRLQSQETANFQLYDEFTQRQQELIELKDDARTREESFHLRELEFRNQELEYRTQLEEATRQLHQSQQQAESATQAVQRMREQFESLNEQIEDLSGQHSDIEGRELRQRAEHERLRAQLEIARDHAIDAQAQSEARRQDAESRVDAMAAQIADLQSEHGDEATDHQSRLAESEMRATQLNEQVVGLQQSVSEASDEAAQLRADYEEACESVRQLETLVSESNQRGDQDRESWAVEADELRSAVDQLSNDLERANSELGDLRDANQDLTSKLTEVQLERDEARDDAASRPSAGELTSLRSQLEDANEQLAQMKLDYDTTLAKLQEVEQERNLHRDELGNSEQQIATDAGLTLAGAKALVTDGLNVEEQAVDETAMDDVATFEQAARVADHAGGHSDSEASETVAEDSELEDGAWPTYGNLESETENVQATEPHFENERGFENGSAESSESVQQDLPENDASTTVTDSVWGEVGRAESGETSVSSTQLDGVESHADQDGHRSDQDHGRVEDHSRDADDGTLNELHTHVDLSHGGTEESSVWPEQTLATENATLGDASVESNGIWASSEATENCDGDAHETADESQALTPDATFEDPAYVPGDVTLEDEMRVSDSSDDDELIGGSLASMLIKDLESESEVAPLDGGDSDSGETHAGGAAKNHEWNGWDREYEEELEPTEWTNDPDGYRVEGHEPAGVPPLATPENLDAASQKFADHNDHESTPIFMKSTLETTGQASDDPAYADTGRDDEAVEPNEQLYASEHDASQDALDVQEESPAAIASSTVDYEPEPDFAHDDDSIEAYMNRLLRRVQGEPGGGASVDQADGEAMEIVGGQDEPVTEWSESEGDESPDAIDQNTPMVPLSQAPERGTDLDAMRELANASARIAITRSVRMQTRDTQIKGLFSFICAAGAITCGAACYYFLPGVIRYLAVAMTVVVSVIYVREGFLQFQEASQRLRSAVTGISGQSNDAETGEHDSKVSHDDSQESSETV